ncbi:MAG TPA: hypothetical protein VLV81_11715 [Acidimicrobiia bacterium]|nr:hypothetical protein [Acidimicrobiia bacterium]
MDDPRRLWTLIEPYHATIYFAPEVPAAFEAIGVRGFWRSYFAGRAAPLGRVEAGVVTACFYGFHPGFVARAVPSVWSLVTPETAIETRLRGVHAGLRRLLDVQGRQAHIVEAAELLQGAWHRSSEAGRPVFAANAELAWPTEPDLALWHAATLVREHRGDAHVAALTVAGLDPCEAHVTQTAASGASLETIQPYRGWADADWRDAAIRLQERGWLDAAGQLTEAGRAGRAAVEHDTDRLAAAPLERLGPGERDRLLGLLESIVAPLIRSGAIPYPNPIGVPAPDST